MTEIIENWIQKVDRLAKHGSQYELPAVYKTAAVHKFVIGESKRMFETWRLEGLPFERLLVKLEEYARSKRLDGDASKG